MLAHLVLTTKYRRKVLTKSILERLKQHIHNLCSKWNVLVIELEGEDNHIHLLFSYYPQLDLCKFINNLKTVTSRLIRKEFEHELNKIYRGKPVFWKGSYFIATRERSYCRCVEKIHRRTRCSGALIKIPSAIPRHGKSKIMPDGSWRIS